jgi:hypothetical protein
MSATQKKQISDKSKRPRARFERGTLLRFHNSLYLGCVIGVLTGCGFGQALLAWPKRAWQRASPRRTNWASPMMVARREA